MAIKATLRQQSGIKASLNNKKEVVAQTIKVSSGNIGLGDLNNVNLTGATDGSGTFTIQFPAFTTSAAILRIA